MTKDTNPRHPSTYYTLCLIFHQTLKTMNSHPITSAHELPKNQDLTVCLQIEQQDTQTLLSFLLSKQISFELVYHPVLSSSLKAGASVFPSAGYVPKEESVSALPPSHLSTREKIEWAYDYYIQRKHTQNVPAETEIASQLEIATSQFRSLFKKIYGKGFYQLYLEKRMEYASKLLRKGLKCNEVAKMVGYGSNSAIKFNKMFQKHFGVTPKKYQLQHAS